MSRSSVPEHLLHALWRDHTSFVVPNAILTDGSRVRILDAGEWNEHRGGPDFLGAKIAIDNVAISGDIELHKEAANWGEHKHHLDPRYSNVVLHVLLEGAEDTLAPDIPTLVLRDNLQFDRRELWDQLFARVYDSAPELPCYPHNIQIPMRFKRMVLEKFGDARLEELIDRVSLGTTTSAEMLERVYQLSMDAFGYAQNRTPFRELSALIPRSRLQFVRSSFEQDRAIAFESLFFGVAGLLPQPSSDFDAQANDYLLELNSRWNAIQTSIRFPEVLAESDWAFFRIRPLNSPYRRLALAAHMAERYYSDPNWNFESRYFKGEFELVSDSFWNSRTSFGQPLDAPHALLGDERRAGLWLNVTLPANIARMRTLADTPANRATERAMFREWGDAKTKSSAKYLRTIQQELLEGENVNSVRSEQGALILQRNFCDKGRCAECPIGSRLIEKGWKQVKKT